jgi:hypothetical protein
MPHGRRVYLPDPSEDYRAPLAARDPRTRAPALLYDTQDEIETACPGCTLIWRDGAFTHENSCPFRRSRPRAGRPGAA